MAVSTVEGDEPSLSRMTDDDNPEARLGIRLPPTRRSPQGPRTNQLIYIRDVILKAMIRHPGSFWFRKPIDPVKLRLVNYYEFIKQPMDLETIRNRITNRYYQGAKECLEDFQLMFCNCYVYNLPDSAVTKEARELEMTLLRKLVDMEETEEVIPEGTPIYKKKQWSTTKECAILNESMEEDEGGNGEEIRRALRVREPKKSLEVPPPPPPPQKKAGGGKKIKSGGNGKKIGKKAKGKRGSVFYRLNKERRKKRLEMFEKQMDFLKGLVEQMKKDEVKDKQLCRKLKRKRSRSSGGEKKKTTGSQRSRSGTPVKKTPTKSQQDGAGSSKKKISPMGPPPPPKSTPGESEKAKSPPFKTPKPVAASKSKPPSTTSKSKPVATSKPKPVATSKPKPVATSKPKPVATSKPKPVATSKPKPVATSKPKPVATSKPKPPPTPTPSTSNSKVPSIPTPSGSSTSKSKTPELLLDKTSRMSPEILQQLKSMLDQLSDEDMADIVQVVSYYDYEEPEEEDDEDILNLKALPHTCQWEIWGMTETKLGMANAKKKSKETTEVLQEEEAASASVTPSAVQVDNDPFIFGAVHQDSPDPVSDPSSGTEPVVPVFSSMDDDINDDDDDEDDDTLLDIY